jgi:hypothetical protein
MQRLIEATLIKNILEKYQGRYDECQAQWDKDWQELKDNIVSEDRKDFILTDIANLNMQLSAYECIIKDLKELIK